MFWNFPDGPSGKEPTCQCRKHKRHEFDPWVGKIPCRRTWQPTPVFLPEEFHRQRSLVGYSPWDHRVGHYWSILAHTHAHKHLPELSFTDVETPHQVEDGKYLIIMSTQRPDLLAPKDWHHPVPYHHRELCTGWSQKLQTTPHTHLPLKMLCWNPLGISNFGGTWAICLLAWPCNKHFCSKLQHVVLLGLTVCLVQELGLTRGDGE